MPRREVLEALQVLHDDANDWRQHPGLVLLELAGDVAQLSLEGVQEDIGYQGPAEVLQRVIPAFAHLRRKCDLVLLVANGRQRRFIIVELEVTCRLVALAGEQRGLIKSVEMQLVVVAVIGRSGKQFLNDRAVASGCGQRGEEVHHVNDLGTDAPSRGPWPADERRHADAAFPGRSLVAFER